MLYSFRLKFMFNVESFNCMRYFEPVVIQYSNVANKVGKSIGIILKCSFFLPKTSVLGLLYYSLIYP